MLTPDLVQQVEQAGRERVDAPLDVLGGADAPGTAAEQRPDLLVVLEALPDAKGGRHPLELLPDDAEEGVRELHRVGDEVLGAVQVRVEVVR